MNKQIIGTAIITLLVGGGAGFWIASQKQPVSQQVEKGKSERKPLFYRNPMNPEITSPVPAKDSMGMDYIPVYADGDQASKDPSGTVSIDPVVVQNIGVRTTKAVRKTLTREIQSVGRIDYNEERITRLHPKTEGWVSKLFIDKTGEQVKKGTILLSLYSPQLVSSQEEYLLALKNAETLKNSPFPDIRRGAIDLLRSSRERLELLDVPEHQIRELEKTRKLKKNLHIHSPFDGIVVNIGVREGQFVTPQTELYMIADLSKVWTYVDVYEYELPWIKVGDEAHMRLTALPGRTFTGKITYIYPYLEAKTRTIKVRLEFDNADLALKPDMFADVSIHASRQVNAVVIPDEAIVRTGNREQVFVVRGPGKFEPREVRLGISADGLVQVLEGVREGEEVVTSAQFLIDSESKLREAAAKMMEATKYAPEPRVEPGMDMKEMKMDGMNMEGEKSK
jgi:Cu(I)/Ag(I) efflux system membrane fusion protein